MTLSTPEVKRRLREAVNDGSVMYGDHAQKRMVKRGFTVPDVERCLSGGFHDHGRDELKDGTWRYRIQGKTVDGDDIKVAVAIEDNVVVITVID